MADTPRAAGERWAKRMAQAGRTVVGPEDLPSSAAVRFLERTKLLTSFLDGVAWVLHTPETADRDTLATACYWQIVARFLVHHAPAALDRGSVVRLALGEETPPSTLFVRHARSGTERRYALAPDLAVYLLPLPADVTPSKVGLRLRPGPRPRRATVTVANVTLPVMPAPWVLLAMPLSELREEWTRVTAWLSTLTVPAEQLATIYAAWRRPEVASRLAEVASDLGNTGLAERLRAAITDRGDPVRHRLARLPIPVIIRSRPVGDAAYLTRFRAHLELLREALVASALPASPRLTRAVREAVARTAKRDDVYHSTTIEGYRITPEDLDAVFSGRPVRGTTPEEAERRFALLGYAHAFDVTLERFEEALIPFDFTVDDALDLHEALWYPSVDAGILETTALREVRRDQVYLATGLHVPPSPEKVRPLLGALGQYLRDTPMSGAVRAGLLHAGFEGIHPFRDGNGRVGRLLMNLALAAEGYPWVTIHVEDRRRYFDALERAQVHDDGALWGAFLRELLGKAQGHVPPTIETTVTPADPPPG